MPVANVRKMRHFVIEMDGVDQFKVQKITRPKRTVNTAEHGNFTHNIKTASSISYDNAVLEMVKTTDETETAILEWLNTTINPATGTVGLPSDYKRDIVVKEVDGNGNALDGGELWKGCFVVEYEPGELDRTSDDNVIPKVSLNVDEVRDV